MGQWGKARDFTLPNGGVMTISPHVETFNVFGLISAVSKVDMLVVTDVKPAGQLEANEEILNRLVEKYVGRPHQEWVDGHD